MTTGRLCPEFVVVGAGALGLLLAARLWRAGASVALITRTAWQADLLKMAGITVHSGDGRWTVWPEVAPSLGAVGKAAWILVTVKSWATSDVLHQLRAWYRDGGCLGWIQNGLTGFDEVAHSWPGPALAVVAGMGAWRRNPVGVEEGGQSPTVVGPLVHAGRTLADALAQRLNAAGWSTRATDDPWPDIWRKLCVNAAINPLGALLGRVNGELLADPVRRLLRRLAQEAGMVARAYGYDPGPNLEAYVEAVAQATARNRCSMLQDVEAGRPTEVEAIVGALLRRAEDRGVPTPVLARSYTLLKRRVGTSAAPRKGW